MSQRSTLIAITWSGFALGAVLGGIISVPLISKFGWTSVFVVGGILPLCLVPFIILALPESIKFLIVARQKPAAVASILQKISPRGRVESDSVFFLDEAQSGHGQISALFRNGLAVGSIFLCLAFFMSLMLVYLFINWIPLLLHQAGLPLQNALMGTIIFNLSGILGSILCTQLIDRKIGVVVLTAILEPHAERLAGRVVPDLGDVRRRDRVPDHCRVSPAPGGRIMRPVLRSTSSSSREPKSSMRALVPQNA